MGPTNSGEPTDPDAEDDDGPLDPFEQPDELDADGDDASPVCLRCFAPLEGAPTKCPNCGAPASLAATLGPSAGGGVDVGGRTAETLDKTYDGHLSPWSVAIVWGLGMIVLQYAVYALLVWPTQGPSASFGRPRLLPWLPFAVLALWTAVCAWFFGKARARQRAARERTQVF